MGRQWGGKSEGSASTLFFSPLISGVQDRKIKISQKSSIFQNTKKEYQKKDMNQKSDREDRKRIVEITLISSLSV